ncbi:UNVERIFIED_CONTAM: hypothetical protein NCL1_39823 [Trichonephila clavipes]
MEWVDRKFLFEMENIWWKINVLILTFFISMILSDTGVHSQYVSYNDIVQMGAQCDPFDNCRQRRQRDQLSTYNCNCDESCVQFDTCCIDSPYRSVVPVAPTTDMKCRRTYKYGGPVVYMIDTCKNRNLPKEALCESGDPEQMKDPFLLVPVTSLKTGKTYKNHFCAVCNEDTNAQQLVPWNIELNGRSQTLKENNLPDLTYDENRHSWRIIGEDDGWVYIKIKIPDTLQHIVKTCILNLISNCSSSWTDASVRNKCTAFMAKVAFRNEIEDDWYRNPYCAICNFEKIASRVCQAYEGSGFAFVDQTPFVKLFVLKDRDTKCGPKMAYDTFAKKCRCNSRDSIMKDRVFVRRS